MHIPHSQYHGCWWPGNTRSQDISSHGIDQEYSGLSTARVKDWLRSSDAIWRHKSGSTVAQAWLVAWWHQAISWTKVDLSSVRSCDIHLRAIECQTNILYDEFEYYTFKIPTISPRGQWVNALVSWLIHFMMQMVCTLLGLDYLIAINFTYTLLGCFAITGAMRHPLELIMKQWKIMTEQDHMQTLWNILYDLFIECSCIWHIKIFKILLELVMSLMSQRKGARNYHWYFSMFIDTSSCYSYNTVSVDYMVKYFIFLISGWLVSKLIASTSNLPLPDQWCPLWGCSLSQTTPHNCWQTRPNTAGSMSMTRPWALWFVSQFCFESYTVQSCAIFLCESDQLTSVISSYLRSQQHSGYF